MLAYLAEMDLALTYALRRPKLAMKCIHSALDAAHAMRRPDLGYRAVELLGILAR